MRCVSSLGAGAKKEKEKDQEKANRGKLPNCEQHTSKTSFPPIPLFRLSLKSVPGRPAACVPHALPQPTSIGSRATVTRVRVSGAVCCCYCVEDMVERKQLLKWVAVLGCGIVATIITYNDMPPEAREKTANIWSNILQRPMVIIDNIMAIPNPWQVVRLPVLGIACALLGRYFRKRVEAAAAKDSPAPTAGGGAPAPTKGKGKKHRKDKAS